MEKGKQMSKDNTIAKPTTKTTTKAKPKAAVKAKAIEYDMEALTSKADLLGVEYHPNIGGKKLKEKIDLHVAEIDTDSDQVENVYSVGPSKTIAEIEKAARKTRRVIIMDNDVRDQSNPTIVLTVGNSHFKVGGIIKKEIEQDVPQILLDEIISKPMVRFVNAIDNITKRPTGNKVPTSAKRFTIQYID